jgi:hypothetical protein
VTRALTTLWEASDRVCGKRLVALPSRWRSTDAARAGKAMVFGVSESAAWTDFLIEYAGNGGSCFGASWESGTCVVY